MKPPVAKKQDYLVHSPFVQRVDDYYWLRERENPEVLEHLAAENMYAHNVLSPATPIKDTMYEEIKSHIAENDSSTPILRGDYYYYHRMESGKSYPIYCRKHLRLDSEEIVILDVNELAKDHKQFIVSDVRANESGDRLAYTVDLTGSHVVTLYFKNLLTGETLHEETVKDIADYCWTAHCDVFYYTVHDDSLRPYRLYARCLCSARSSDVLLYEDLDERFWVGAYMSATRRLMYVYSISKTTSEIRYLPANLLQPTSDDIVLFQTRKTGVEYYVNDVGGMFFVRTNENGTNFCILSTSSPLLDKSSWQTVLAARENVFIEEFWLYTDYLVTQERHSNGLVQVYIHSLQDNHEHYYLPFPDPIYAVNVQDSYRSDTHQLRYSYSSLTTPLSVFVWDMRQKTSELLKQQAVLGDFSVNDYVSERLWAVAEDGTHIPISLVYRKGMLRDGSNKCLLYGYGSYGISVEPTFSAARLVLLNRGFIFAIAHIRGGQELGRSWYDNGKLLHKKNTFTDFISCAEHLISEGYTCADKLCAMGGSAGGMLMGAVMNMRPELFKAVVAQVPFVDVMTTMLDETLPLTVPEYEEWGNLNEKHYHDYMLSYSPYDNIQRQNYPHVLVETGFHDTNVAYWEPAKWVAKLREYKTDQNLLLLNTKMTAGHSGASGRYDTYKELAFTYSFLVHILSENGQMGG